MSPVVEFVFLLAAGFGAGLIGYVTGLASVVSYPALLAVGLSPVAANVTNTISVVAVGIGSTTQAGKALFDGERRRTILGIVASVIGGVIGAAALLLSSEGSFEVIVPFLVALAALALLCQPALRKLATHDDKPWLFFLGMLAISVYGGYFGAGAGIMVLALMLVVTSEPLWKAALSKSLFLGISNTVAAIAFIIWGPVDWWAAIVMGVGCFAGGWCGPPVVKRLPAGPLRITIGIGGLALAVWLGVR
ncbi:TSUP family transporter [Gordonia amarae]|uniref:Probable membrane transporter protein n=2 Tax=Gordonia amarae TaxID=36821 RepID=G7GU09_9ACTN|nr:sulfite exporter TauE/SafE family protein [Gordonia amarae]MCS3877688.1 putative membrane protein YfcA [Gordonia amarae]QHN16395.1 TSUP family transporter [Gordonia amarae]QHN20964.1 TSUP family transporter [Gordonia amarae]QHN29816.1 TSUP family transporter [Gordonia amarae]QHN38590.1 TSUP family transporter [Gordonia amarae]